MFTLAAPDAGRGAFLIFQSVDAHGRRHGLRELVIVVTLEKVGDVDYYYLSGAQTGTSYDGSAEYPTGTAALWGSDDYSTANWHAVSTSGGGGESVPEPTSGLLMLIGAAGLALRRKRA